MKNNRLWLWTAAAVLIVAVTYTVFNATHRFYKVYWMGTHMYNKGDYFRALPYLIVAHRMSPDDKTIAWKLVWTYQRLGREEEGRHVLEEIGTRFPTDPEAGESLGDMAYSTKSYLLAQRYYEYVLSHKPSARVRKKYAETLLAEKRYNDAVYQMDILLSNDPNDQQLRLERVPFLSAAGYHDRAVRELGALIEEGFKKKEALTMLADELRSLGRDQEAIKIYQEVSNEK